MFRFPEISVIHLRTFKDFFFFQAFEISIERFGWLAFIPLDPKDSLRNLSHEFGASVKQLP